MSSEEVFFKWSDDYSVNISEIDEQHKELVGILNLIFVAVSRREGEKVVAEILDSLFAYTQTHFALEERLMKEAGYQGLEQHREEHKELIAQLNELTRKFMLDEKPIYFEMLAFLRTWLRAHILGSDMKYSAALQKIGFSTAQWERGAQAEFASLVSASRKKQWWKLWQPA
jgi:hemerythrin